MSGNVNAAAFLGNALRTASQLKLDGHIVGHIIESHKDLTSHFPLIGGLQLSAAIGAAHVATDIANAVTHAVTGHNTGHHGR